MPIHLLTLLLASAGAAMPAAPQHPVREWVTKEVISPDILPWEDDLRWNAVLPSGDHDADGCVDSLIHVSVYRAYSQGGFWVQFRDGLWGAESTLLEDSNYKLGTGGWDLVALGLPMGIGVATIDNLPNRMASIWDLDPFTIMGIVRPPGPPPDPPLTSIRYILPGGDINQDGWEDFFFQSHKNGELISGLIDSQSFSVAWQHRRSLLDHEVPTRTTGTGPTPDFNLDGCPDFLSTAFLYDPAVGQLEHLHLALSGIDGSVIWEYRGLQPWPFSYDLNSAVSRDFNGDGVPDIVSAGCGEVRSIDGATGQLLWRIDEQAVWPFLPSWAGIYYTWYPSFETQTPGSPGDSEACVVIWYMDAGYFRDHLEILHIEGATGTVLAVAAFPDTLFPWWPDPVHHDPHPRFFPLGDVDRDGLEEIARTVRAPTLDNPSTGHFDEHLAIFGMRTLYVPEDVPIGSTVTAEVTIPSGVGMSFRLLLSDGFERKNGVFLDGWPTHLAPCALFQRSMVRPETHGVLDAQGEGSITVTIPNQISLVGRRIWSKAVVEDPNRPGGVWTMSTLGEMTITL